MGNLIHSVIQISWICSLHHYTTRWVFFEYYWFSRLRYKHYSTLIYILFTITSLIILYYFRLFLKDMLHSYSFIWTTWHVYLVHSRTTCFVQLNWSQITDFSSVRTIRSVTPLLWIRIFHFNCLYLVFTLWLTVSQIVFRPWALSWPMLAITLWRLRTTFCTMKT